MFFIAEHRPKKLNPLQLTQSVLMLTKELIYHTIIYQTAQVWESYSVFKNPYSWGELQGEKAKPYMVEEEKQFWTTQPLLKELQVKYTDRVR